MRAAIAAALVLLASACTTVTPSEPVVHAMGAGVEESVSHAGAATAAPAVTTEANAPQVSAAAPTAKVKTR